MKKIYSYMVAAVATVAAISCTQELDNQRVTDTSVFTAFADGADTKTVKEGKQSLWSEGDRIWVLNGQKGDDNDYSWKKSYTTSSDATNEAVFNEDQEYEMTGNAFFAVYPACAADKATWAGQGNEVKHVELKKVQTATPDSFDPEAHIAVAQTTDNTLLFKNAVSLLKFRVQNEGVKSVTISSNNIVNRELLTGLCSISADGNVTAWTNKIDESTPEAENWVELSAGDGEFANDADYYIAVFPVIFENGFKVEFSYGGDKLPVKSHNEKLELFRNGVLDLGVIEHDVPDPKTIYLVPGQWASDNAWFAVAYNGGIYKMEVDDDGYYTYDLPGYVENFAFYRMNSASEDLTEGNKWNEIPDITVPADENNYFVWNSWDAPYGSWEPKPEEKSYSIVGEFNNWGDSGDDVSMEKVAVGLYSAKNITRIGAFTKWKVRVNGAWDESYGASVTGIEANKWAALGSSDTSHAVDGAVDIYLDVKQSRIYVMSSGVDYSTAVQQTVSITPPPTGTPVKDGYLYLRPSSQWLEANAHFAAWIWKDNGSGKVYNFNKHESVPGVYELKLNGANKMIIFRMDPNKTVTDGSTTWPGDNHWYKSGDINITGNLYTVVGWHAAGTGFSTITEL